MKRRNDWKNKTRQLVGGVEGGANLVQLALIIPTFMMLLTGIFGFAFAYYNSLTLTQAVNAAAQYVQQKAPYATDPCADAYNKIVAAAPTLVAANISVSVTINGGTPSTGTSCPQSLSSDHGDPVKVSASYPCNLHVLNFAVSPSCKLQAQATQYLY